MNFNKYIYVSPQQFSNYLKEWQYEYIKDGKAYRTQHFGYHQGKDVIKKLERDAWRFDLKLRMLTSFQWRELRYTLLGEPYTAEDTTKLLFRSMSQFERFTQEMERSGCMVKPLTQLKSGEIVLQVISEDSGRYLGYLKTIGTRGGVRSDHDYCVELRDGIPCLVKRMESLFVDLLLRSEAQP